MDLMTGRILVFSLPPIQAVIAAHEQAKGNGNTWDYSLKDSKPQLGPSGKTIFCGQFGAML